MENKALSFTEQMNARKELAIQTANNVNELMPVKLVKTIEDATFLVNTAMSFKGKFNLAICKIFQRVKDEKLYESNFKNFETWAKDCFGENKVTAYNYAKVGKLIDENGHNTILPRPDKEYDYSYSSLVIIMEKLVKIDRKTGEINENDLQKLIEYCKQGKLFPNMSRDELKKALNKLTKTNDKTEIDENGESVGNVDELDENGESENESESKATKAKTISLKFTIDDGITLLNAIEKVLTLKEYKDNENVRKIRNVVQNSLAK